ncbi:Proteasome subunit beta type-7 [Podospora bellae-mahoneyi]|uniref:Proteasome subunit beta n=1 Tax=Podospora bellae-mahoneyi TaxID=2093777 RepID=A0ABR0G0U6_9PEZI|nr:Proteasome subunit beta type-7 [Podospora bellae-mahoneyi]
MDHRPQAWGRPRDDVYGAYDASYLNNSGPRTVTQSPVVTGTSVIAIKYKDGVVMAADNLASYGSLARFTDVKRLRTFLDTTVIGFGGDVSDMQFLDRHLKELATDESYEVEPTLDDEDDEESSSSKPGHLNAANLFKYLQKLMYQRRNSFDPLWNQILVAGLDSESKPFLASVDLRGTSFTSPSLATGFGAALAQPIMRKYAGTEEDAAKLTREQAVEVVKECMKVLFYRDARSLDRYSIAVVNKDGIELEEDQQLEKQSWAFAERIKGYGTQTV